MGRVDNIMNEEKFSENSLPAELIAAKFIELKDSAISKYFFLYFLNLMGYLTYKEENGEAVFADDNNTFKVPMPIIDSEEKYKEDIDEYIKRTEREKKQAERKKEIAIKKKKRNE